jgi:hypothetical protein
VIWESLRPKRPAWFRRTAVLAGATLATYAAAAWWTAWAPGNLGGLLAGTGAAILFVIDGLYPLRRPLLGWPFGTAQGWLQFHTYGGVMGGLLVLVHAGFRWPGGQFGWWLLGLSIWTTISGLVGVWLQKAVPLIIVGNMSVEALYERIPELVGRLQAEADKLIEGSSEVLERTYMSDIRPQLASVNPSWSQLFDIRRARDERMRPLQRVAQFLSDDERERLADLTVIFSEKTELDIQFSLQQILRQWKVIHVPPSILLLALMVVHVVAVVYF